MKRIFLLFSLVVTLLTLSAQEPADSLRKDALNVYMEASDYIRNEILFLNYVRDIKDGSDALCCEDTSFTVYEDCF